VLKVRLDTPGVNGLAIVSPDDVEEIEATDEENPCDFSHSGLGIGGLAHYEEPPFVPSAAAIERVEEMERRARYCRKCGQSDVFDGAMFTTDAGSGICDDCY